jgi:glycogen debranching enzyme
MAWADTCFQQILSARHLLRMAAVLGREKDAAPLAQEVERLSRYVNDMLWDPKTSFYYDRFGDGSQSFVKSIGAYWALLADVVPKDRLDAFVAHLSDERTFKRPHRVPTLANDHPAYRADGGYWLGAVWAPTNYMVLRGLTRLGKDDLAREIARNHLDNVTTVFEKTGTVWENYAPESAAPGDPAKADFVGWTGLVPIAVLYEYVLGIRADVPRSRVVWDVALIERHGITRLPFGREGTIDLVCEARNDAKARPVVRITTTVPIELELRWAGGRETMAVPA